MSIRLNRVSYTYAPGTPLAAGALRDVTLEVQKGEFVGIMGRTGCGKSTLIALMAGLLEPQSGQVFLDGEDINSRDYHRPKLREKVGVVFQYPEYQLFETTVERDVAFGLKHLALSQEEKNRRIRWALELMGFDYDKIARLSPLGLSGGEKRRVAIAGVLAVQPEYLILDEPVAGLDPLGREAFLQVVESLCAFGTAILMISHNADALAQYAKRIILLEDGGVKADGTPGKVLRLTGQGQVQQTLRLLRQKGYSLPEDIVRYEELLPQLARIGKGGGRG